ncbi:MAG: L,D-transpeptidase family protein [Planctomycetota bacterium]|nr:L,D-transpeptidase family protein [Planctomycetota bacterium]
MNRQAAFRAPSRSRRHGPAPLIVATLLVAGGLGAWYWGWGRAALGPNPARAADDAPPPAIIPTREPVKVQLGQPKGPVLSSLERTPQTTPSPTLAAADTAAPPRPSPQQTEPAPTTASTISNPASTAAPNLPSTSPGTSNPPPSSGPSAAQPQTPSAAPATTTQAPPPAPARDPAIQRLVAAADSSIAAGRKPEARLMLNRALHDPRATDPDVEMLRARITDLNAELVFSPTVVAGDPLADTHTIQPGDRLVKIVQASDLKVDWRFIQRINRMSDPGRLRVGQKLKVVKGPFHAVVHKDAYRLDLYSDATDTDGNRLYIRSFPVGLGENDSTPLGKWFVRPASKLVNPHWVNPRTGERFDANDPKNPIGEHWLGIVGAEPATEVLSGYGLHGTIEPESIGRDASMGCVRMQNEDIALIYEMLVEQHSSVEIKP